MSTLCILDFNDMFTCSWHGLWWAARQCDLRKVRSLNHATSTTPEESSRGGIEVDNMRETYKDIYRQAWPKFRHLNTGDVTMSFVLAHGSTSFGRMPFGRQTFGRHKFDPTTLAELDKSPSLFLYCDRRKMPVDKIPVGQMVFGQITWQNVWSGDSDLKL